MGHKIINTENYLLIVDDSEIKEGDYVLIIEDREVVLSKGKMLNNNFVKKVIAHLPLNNSPILEGVALLPPIEDEFEKKLNENCNPKIATIMIKGYNKAKEKYKYTEEDMRKCWKYASIDKNQIFGDQIGDSYMSFIQSLQQPKIPVGFKCDYEPIIPYQYTVEDHLVVKPKTIINSQGLTQWVGEYIY